MSSTSKEFNLFVGKDKFFSGALNEGELHLGELLLKGQSSIRLGVPNIFEKDLVSFKSSLKHGIKIDFSDVNISSQFLADVLETEENIAFAEFHLATISKPLDLFTLMPSGKPLVLYLLLNIEI